MKTKILALLTITLIAMLTTSYAYACLTSHYHPTSRHIDIEFTRVTSTDNEQNFNTADIQAIITRDRNTIMVWVSNAYPNYEATLKYTIKNIGSYPVKFSAPTIINPNPEALEVKTTNHQSVILYPQKSIQGTTKILILSTAQQNTRYTFQIQNTAQQNHQKWG
jgi:hypothetical protein